MNPGDYKVVLAAIDRAGNKTELEKMISIEAAVAPKITYYTDKISENESIYVRGESVYPNAALNLTLKSTYGAVTNYDVLTDPEGKFSFGSEPLQDVGSYEFWASALNQDGSKGPSSARFTVTVEKRLASSLIAGVLKYPEELLWLLFILLTIALIGWYKYIMLKLKYHILEKELEKKKREYIESVVANTKAVSENNSDEEKIKIPRPRKKKI